MSNRLSGQTSPYLLQHAENPVDWYPWCDEAFARASAEDKPVFLSIGYSTCHWCHVMAHESFEHPEIAEILNRQFIAVKVDREERPDIDAVYMDVCQAFTGSGGWPMSIFLTPQQKPFFAGTYFPPDTRQGIMGFRQLLTAIARKWDTNRDELLESAEELLSQLSPADSSGSGRMAEPESAEHVSSGSPDDLISPRINLELPKEAAAFFSRSFDAVNGGFGRAPKFPTPHNLLFLTLYSRVTGEARPLEQVKKTLEQLRRGGIFDHIGWGFSRYSTDSRYLVPHFEKMLYDNALMILACSAAFRASGNSLFLDTAEKTAEYILREMTGPDGEFYSAQDADSEREEGRFYVWDKAEILSVLGKERGEAFCAYFAITGHGNFEGKNIPNLLNGNAVDDPFAREKGLLYDYRKSRASLHIDDKVLTAWNSLMICSLTALYRVSGSRRYLAAAERAQQFIEKQLTDGSLLYVSRRKEARSVKGFLDDYACYTAALLFLYETAGGAAYLDRAEQLCHEAMEQFADKNGGGYFLWGSQNAPLITRPKESYDGALPSGNSVMAFCLVRLSQLTGREEYRQAAERQLAFLSAEAADYPAGHCLFLTVLLLYRYPPSDITVVLAPGDRPETILPRLPLSARLRLLEQPADGYSLLNGRTTYYVCRGYTCFPPSNQEPSFL